MVESENFLDVIRQEAKKVIGNIFADLAKYCLTIGIIGQVISDKVDSDTTIGIILIAAGSGFIAYMLNLKKELKS